MSKKKLCISTYVSGKDYQEFIPIYIFSICKSYPDYDVIIFIGEDIASNISSSLDILSDCCNFEVISNYLPFFQKNIGTRVSSQLKRFLIFSNKFYDYEYVYIGDVDVFIINENPELADQHIVHCKTIGLDYSNVMRRSGEKRITGLHFVRTEPYFSKMFPVIMKYTDLMKRNKLDLEYTNDEYLLYKMIEEAKLGLCPKANGKDTGDPRRSTFRPIHGVHLAVFRDFIVKRRRVNSLTFKNKMKALKRMIDDPLFVEIEKNFESRLVKRIFRKVHNFKVE